MSRLSEITEHNKKSSDKAGMGDMAMQEAILKTLQDISATLAIIADNTSNR